MSASVAIGMDADSKRLASAVIEGGAIRAVATITRANSTGRIDPKYDQLLIHKSRIKGEEPLFQERFSPRIQGNPYVARD